MTHGSFRATVLGERWETEFVQELEEQSARIEQALERVASLRDGMGIAASAGNADEGALLRNTYLPREDDPGIVELRAAVEERLQQAKPRVRRWNPSRPD